MAGSPRDPQAKPEMKTLVKTAVTNFRAMSADANQGHGRDLMPGIDDEYELHGIDGGILDHPDDIRWETVAVNGKSETRADLVLVWRNPAEMLLAATSD